ncbi:NPC1-like intracellular cholesterol transporter 1 isoform X2 [Eriocheir sinensis]|nr:NPC1-like intracellular cholesterol transporter 1 isoform X2 [Eriocheir sinensis]
MSLVGSAVCVVPGEPPGRGDEVRAWTNAGSTKEARKDAMNNCGCCNGPGRWRGAGGVAAGAVERACGWWGSRVAAHPGRAAAAVVVVAAAASLGFLNLRCEWRHYHLWVPQDTLFGQVNAWRGAHFAREPRTHLVLWRADSGGGVLTAASVRAMWRLNQRVTALRVDAGGGEEAGWRYVCLRVPQGEPEDGGSGGVEAAGLEGVWAALARDGDLREVREGVCRSAEAWPRRCLERSLLDLWGGDGSRVAALTDEQVLRDVNRAGARAAAARSLLGGMKRDVAGRVVAAAAALHTWTTRVQVNSSGQVEEGTGRRVDLAGLRWEEALVGEVERTAGGPRPLVLAAHSLGRAATRAVMGDLKWAGVGTAALVAYVAATATHPLPALLGLLLGLPLAMLAAYGLCAALAVPFSFLGAALPVLAAGIGVDHMYLLAAAWGAAGRKGGTAGSIAERGGRALRRVGAAITLTCVTDGLAFMVGASTRLPGLRWFCLYAAATAACVFLLHVTFFLAALALHQRRQDAAGAARCPAPPCRVAVLPRVMACYADLLLRPAVSAAVVAGAAALLGAGLWGAASLRHQLTIAEWLLPRASPVRQALEARRQFFPSQGVHATVYFANVTLPQELPGLTALADALRASPYVHSVTAWFTAFQDSLPPLLPRPLSPRLFSEALALFLHLPRGARFAWDLEFAAPLRCLEAAPRVTAFRMHLQHRALPSMAQQRAALLEVQRLVAEAPLGGFRGAWADAYSQWEAAGVVTTEAARGLALVAVLVGVVTVVVVGAGRAAALVVACVAAVLVEVAAAMHVAGLAVNTVTATALVLAAGLSVDYAAHVAHAFTSGRGSRRERVRATLEGVGPPLVHAGVSTLLTFAALAPAASLLFTAYCTVLTAVAALSLLHALVLLPVLLAWLGPPPRPRHDPDPASPKDSTTALPSLYPAPPRPARTPTNSLSRPNTPPPPPPQPPTTTPGNDDPLPTPPHPTTPAPSTPQSFSSPNTFHPSTPPRTSPNTSHSSTPTPHTPRPSVPPPEPPPPSPSPLPHTSSPATPTPSLPHDTPPPPH